jgi:hypothetical protein
LYVGIGQIVQNRCYLSSLSVRHDARVETSRLPPTPTLPPNGCNVRVAHDMPGTRNSGPLCLDACIGLLAAIEIMPRGASKRYGAVGCQALNSETSALRLEP